MGNEDSNLRFTSVVFEAIRKKTKQSGFINCFDRFDLLLYIYSHTKNDGQTVHFSDLSQYIKQSDVYLASTLKEGVESGYLKSSVCPEDRRRRCYELSDMAASTMEELLSQDI